MAAFGEHNHGTPFGALAPSGFFNSQGQGFYSYSGFSSRDGVLGFSGLSGFSGFSAFCGPTGIEFIPFKPILTFPINFELLSGQVQVTWKEASPPDPCDSFVTYELQFTRTFSHDSAWQTIAMDIPRGTASLLVDFGGVPASDDCGIRIRARDRKSLLSPWSTNQAAFAIANHAPHPVEMLFPLGRETFDGSIPLVWRGTEQRDIDGHNVFYRVEITSLSSKDSGWVAVPDGEKLQAGSVSFNVNSFDFPEGDDFGVRVIAYDELGLGSDPAMVGRLKIRHTGNFFVDTIPPEGGLAINDGDALAIDRHVRLNLFAVDVSSGIKDVRFKNADEDCWGEWEPYSEEKFWTLSSGDGVKRVFVQYRDFADNVSEVCDCDVVSRVFCDEGNATDVEVLNDKLYASFDKNGNLVEYRVLVRQAATVSQPQITSLARLGSFLYMSAYDPTLSQTTIYRYDGTASAVASGISSKALTMVGYNDKLYIGMQDGKVYELDNLALSVSYATANPVHRLRTDGISLFAGVRGGGQYLVFDGSTWQAVSI
jgi:hypothetical protein